MEVMNTHLTDIWKDCVIGKMDEKPFETWTECDSQLIGTLHADLIGLTTPQAQWMHAKFSLIIHDNCSIFGFVFNLTHKDQTMKTIMDMDVKCTGGTGVRCSRGSGLNRRFLGFVRVWTVASACVLHL